MFRICIIKCNWLKKVKIILEGHPFLTSANFISFFLALIPFTLLFIDGGAEAKLNAFIFFIPLLLVYLISLLSYLIYKKSKWISRIFSVVLQSLILIVVQLFYAFLILFVIALCSSNNQYQKIENYELALRQFPQRVTNHFPRIIPESASNIFYEVTPGSFHGGQNIYLKFDIDKEYIENELNTHTYVKVFKYENLSNSGNLPYSFYCNGLDLKDFSFYIIGDKEHNNVYDFHRPYHYGIGVNIDKNQILYYYENPD